ncbi:hypothetical protein VH13_05190 [Corynebacterium ulcerans]|nr:hypothetical protein VH13_05190 [Corynebacterium ulcerans]KKO87240.1 hypothetical protein VH15_05720 [Corynebacterium ulcerans]
MGTAFDLWIYFTTGCHSATGYWAKSFLQQDKRSRTNAAGQTWRGMIAWGDALKRAVLRT